MIIIPLFSSIASIMDSCSKSLKKQKSIDLVFLKELFGILNASEIAYFVSGGFSFEAIGAPSRPHHDLDLLFFESDLQKAKTLLEKNGYTLHNEAFNRITFFKKKKQVDIFPIRIEGEMASTQCNPHRIVTSHKTAYQKPSVLDYRGIKINTANKRYLIFSGFITARHQADQKYLEKLYQSDPIPYTTSEQVTRKIVFTENV